MSQATQQFALSSGVYCVLLHVHLMLKYALSYRRKILNEAHARSA